MQSAFRLPPAIPLAIVAAWSLAAAAQLSGSAWLLNHDTLIERGPPMALAVPIFFFAWLVMIVAMMLPTSLPFIRMFALVSSRQPQRGTVLFCVAGYLAVWCAFGMFAFGGDIAVHRTVDRVAWLAAHPWLIGGSVLAAAGIFQFTPLKDACLRACRLPSNFLLHHYRRGSGAAFRIGARHGLFCVGCCWALMLVSFAAGVASLWWMAGLCALMIVEKTAVRGRTAVPIAGAVLLLWGVLVLLHPPWLPPALSGALS